MKIPAQEVVIPRDKLTRYLLVHRVEDDKSLWLAQVGFTQDNPDDLETAIRDMLAWGEAVRDRSNVYGEYYRVEGNLVGVNEMALYAVSIWIVKAADPERKYRLVTLKPGRSLEE